MNRSKLRMETRELAAKAKGAEGQPRPTDIAEARRLFASVKQEPSDAFQLLRALKYGEEPDWSTWAAIEKFCDEYSAALVEIDNALAIPLAKARLHGI
jgi:hypothetical protein